MTTAETSARSLDPSFADARGWRLRRLLVPLAVGLALFSTFLTFVVLTGLTPLVPTPRVVITFLLINGATILLLLAIVVREVWQIIQARRQGHAAARLHVRVVSLFAVIAVLPAVLVSVAANVTLERGLDRVFSTRTRAMIENSLVVANAYVGEHAKLIRGDIIGVASDISRAGALFDLDRESFRQILTKSAVSRNLPGVMILDKNGQSLVAATTGSQQDFSKPQAELLRTVKEDEPYVALIIEQNFVAAILRLHAPADTFLYVARLLDPAVVARLRLTEAGVKDYAESETHRLAIQLAFAQMFTVIAFTLLLSAVLIGLNFANWLVGPIRRLMRAADLVSTGDLHVQVPVIRSEGDLAQLGETFNKMTHELRTQRDDLVSASDVIDSRRRFIEAVLSSASAGIIGVDGADRISVLNRSAEKLIGRPETEALGKPLSEVVPELNKLMETARSSAQRLVQGQVEISRDNTERNLSVRVTSEQTGQQSNEGHIITLDDITELVTAQRTSAWADVARRIAHEIKNPLTPIQLSAERIRRKFGKVITDDRAIFDQCTDTIIRQVDDIRSMVDEFSRFARMPKPVIEGEDVADTVRQVVFLMRVGHPDIDIEADIKQDPLLAKFDRRLISQGLTNIIKNATEAIGAVPAGEIERGRIEVIAARENDDIVIDVVDNGIGLPKENRARLLEPYVTTREKGTGLGLAIVGRVLEDHGGRIELADASALRPGARGAWMRLRFSISGQAKSAEPENETTKTEAVAGN
ncbi:ATP-binding protein [Bradyrhizobium sp. SYSU BS000235]|uniref:sensor histidine kinase NtrY-like n=1 Tax=Bradyrhizobium sp. SYSU BS000235 TaxID=3411332 RepID=UPI003C76C2AD